MVIDQLRYVHQHVITWEQPSDQVSNNMWQSNLRLRCVHFEDFGPLVIKREIPFAVVICSRNSAWPTLSG